MPKQREACQPEASHISRLGMTQHDFRHGTTNTHYPRSTKSDDPLAPDNAVADCPRNHWSEREQPSLKESGYRATLRQGPKFLQLRSCCTSPQQQSKMSRGRTLRPSRDFINRYLKSAPSIAEHLQGLVKSFGDVLIGCVL